MKDSVVLAPEGDWHERQQEKRQERYQEEFFLVNDLGEGLYEVTNHSHSPESRYLVQAKQTPAGNLWALSCECPDFEGHCRANFLKCKHMLAVESEVNVSLKRARRKVVDLKQHRKYKQKGDDSNGVIPTEKKRGNGGTGKVVIYDKAELLEALSDRFHLEELLFSGDDNYPQEIKNTTLITWEMKQRLTKLKSQLEQVELQLQQATSGTNGKNPEAKRLKYLAFVEECQEAQDLKARIATIEQAIAENDCELTRLQTLFDQKMAQTRLISAILGALSY